METQPGSTSRAARWTGWVLTILPSLLFLMGAVMDFTKPKEVVEGLTKYGYPESVITPLGVTVLISTVLYLLPQTCVLGAILLTGYLGGAVATHVRASDPLWRMMMPVLFGVVIWLALVLRLGNLRAILPLRR